MRVRVILHECVLAPLSCDDLYHYQTHVAWARRCVRDPAMTFDPKCLLIKAHVSIAEVPGLTLVLRCHGYCIYYWYLKRAVLGRGRGLCVSNRVFFWCVSQVCPRGCYAGCYAVSLELQCRMLCDRGPSANSTRDRRFFTSNFNCTFLFYSFFVTLCL